MTHENSKKHKIPNEDYMSLKWDVIYDNWVTVKLIRSTHTMSSEGTVLVNFSIFRPVVSWMTPKNCKNPKIWNADYKYPKRDFRCDNWIILKIIWRAHTVHSKCAFLVNFSNFQIVVSWMTPKNCKTPKISNDDYKHPKRDFRCDNWIIVKMIWRVYRIYSIGVLLVNFSFFHLVAYEKAP